VKLCALTQSYAPTGGGVRTMLHAQRDWCRAQGVHHTLIVPGAADAVEHDGTLTTHTIASPLLPGSGVYRMLLRSDKVLRILRAERPDIIETHCAYNLPWTALLHRRRHGGIVSAVYMTDLPVAYVETPLRRRIGARAAAGARGAVEEYLRKLYGRCDVVVSISPAMRDRLREIGVDDVRLVPLGVDLDTFAPARCDAAIRAELGVQADALLLVYTGRLDREKRPDVVIDAVERLRELCPERSFALVIIGDGPLRGELEARAAALNAAAAAQPLAGADQPDAVAPRTLVRVLPFIDDRHALARLLASADVYVSAMAHETFGLSVVEAQACGLPVVGVHAGAMIDRVRDGIDGYLVPAEDTRSRQDDVANALARRICDTPAAAWRELGVHARQKVEAEFSWNRTFESLFEIYRAKLRH
jgi:alpha-1,6-mannosyltransferase